VDAAAGERTPETLHSQIKIGKRALGGKKAPDEQGRLKEGVSHPFANKEAKGWGMERLALVEAAIPGR
jgi:hypothetical protein